MVDADTEFRDELDGIRKMWWLHDSCRHPTAVREPGTAHANTRNLDGSAWQGIAGYKQEVSPSPVPETTGMKPY